ncbi:MAG: MBL fold metallo-hydrolase [Planctomycetaceae bacterium]|nr:MBL fold metallo-hydrolase [Planctomycetaceae bacterium]
MRQLMCVLCCLISANVALAGKEDQRLDLYFIDVEGGAATLIVTPAGESILIDSGYPDFGGRDLNRILHVLRDVAGLDALDHASVSHWHMDHYGNHAALAAQFPIHNFWDRGIPDTLREDKQFDERIANYRAATQNESKSVKAGDVFDLDSPKTPLKLTVVTASREVIANTGPPNPFAELHQPQDDDASDNAASVSLLFEFGKFRFLTCGDLTWNVEGQLVTPNNPLGRIELFMVTHHGLPVSNNPALVRAIEPLVAVTCNGPTKGGHPNTIATLRACDSLQALYQLHRNVNLSAEEQTPAEYIANNEPTENCAGVWVKASVDPQGNSFTVQIGPDGQLRTYQCR